MKNFDFRQGVLFEKTGAYTQYVRIFCALFDEVAGHVSSVAVGVSFATRSLLVRPLVLQKMILGSKIQIFMSQNHFLESCILRDYKELRRIRLEVCQSAL
jgi:hypothetical protein